MRVVILIAGAGGMYCGSCLRDNRLASTLIEAGRDVTLVPLYTPITTDEPTSARNEVAYGGVSAFAQQLLPFLARAPRWVDRWLDSTVALRLAASYSGSTDARRLGPMTASILRGSDGRQRREVRKLVDLLRSIAPQVVVLPNLMFAGVARDLASELNAAVVCTLSGEDVFIEALPRRWRDEVAGLIGSSAAHVGSFVATSRYYADHASRLYGLSRERVHDVPMGIRVTDFHGERAARGDEVTIGYFARICPEKGLHSLVDAFCRMRTRDRCRLVIGGYAAKNQRAYVRNAQRRLAMAGVAHRAELVGTVDRAGKLALLKRLDILSVPTEYPEAKGLYVLEALAAGVPVVQPGHGAFPELIESTGGGVLYEPAGGSALLAEALDGLVTDAALRAELGRRGQQMVAERFTDRIMADASWKLFEETLARHRKA